MFIHLSFVYVFLVKKDPSGCAELPPAAFLGEKIPPGQNKTNHPAGVSVWGDGQAHVRHHCLQMHKAQQYIHIINFYVLGSEIAWSCEAQFWLCALNLLSELLFFSLSVHPPSGTAQLASTCTTCCKVSHHARHTRGPTVVLSGWFPLMVSSSPTVSTHTEAVLLESSSDSTAIMLYVTVGSIKVSVGGLNNVNRLNPKPS